MMHSFKRFIVVAAVASMVPAIAFASTARMTGLGIPGDYTKDFTNMFTYISSVNSVGNLVYADAGTYFNSTSAYDQAMGAVLPNLFDGRAGVWAIHMRRYHPALGQSWWGAPVAPGYPFYNNYYNLIFDPNQNTMDAESFDLMWGHRMGSANLALRLNRQFFSYDNGTTTVEGNGNNGRNIMGFGAGVGFDMSPNTSVEIGGQYQSRTFDNGATPATTEDGGTAYLVAARAWMKSDANVTYVPVLKLWQIDQSYTNGTTSTTDKLSGWQAGIAGNWAVGHDDLFVLGGQIAGNKDDMGDIEATETLMPNLFMALETHLNPWLTFRAGAQQSVFATYKVKDSSPGGVTTKEKASDFTWMMGTTIKMGNVQFDAVLDPGFLNNPFAQLLGGTNAVYEGQYYLLDGANRAQGGPGYATVFPQVSLTYTW